MENMSFDKKAYMRAYREKHRGRLTEQKKAWQIKNRKKTLAYSKEYDAKNRERIAARMKIYREENKERLRARANEYMNQYRKKYPWKTHFSNAQQRCTNPKRISFPWYGGKGIRMLLTMEEVEILYKRDHADDMEIPSIDRINPKGDYHFGNCRFIENNQNTRGVANGPTFK